MTDKLNTLSSFLRKNNFYFEAGFAKKLCNLRKSAADEADLASMMDRLITENPDVFSVTPEEKDSEEDLSLEGKEGAWRELLSAIRQGKQFKYEIAISDIAEAVSGDTDNLRAIGDVPSASHADRMEVAGILQTNPNIFSDAANASEKGSALLSESGDNRADLNKDAGIGSIAGKIGLKVFKAIPVLGAGLSLTLFVKNVTEAYYNASKLVGELPLQKYNLSLEDATSADFIMGGTIKEIEYQIGLNSDNPENLMEILEIVSVLKAFHLDLIFAVTNAVALILDILTIALGASAIGAAPAGILAIIDIIIQIFILSAVEFGSEYFSETYWSETFSRIEQIAEDAVESYDNMPAAA